MHGTPETRIEKKKLFWNSYQQTLCMEEEKNKRVKRPILAVPDV